MNITSNRLDSGTPNNDHFASNIKLEINFKFVGEFEIRKFHWNTTWPWYILRNFIEVFNAFKEGNMNETQTNKSIHELEGVFL